MKKLGSKKGLILNICIGNCISAENKVLMAKKAQSVD